MRISDWSSDVCSSDLRCWPAGWRPGEGLDAEPSRPGGSGALPEPAIADRPGASFRARSKQSDPPAAAASPFSTPSVAVDDGRRSKAGPFQTLNVGGRSARRQEERDVVIEVYRKVWTW